MNCAAGAAESAGTQEDMKLKTEILGIAFDNLTREEAAQRGGQMLREDAFHYVVTPNPEFILASEKDDAFRTVLNGADMVLPDGIGVVYSAKILGTPLPERVPGIEFAGKMLETLNEMGGRLFLLGAKPGVAEKAGENILPGSPTSCCAALRTAISRTRRTSS